MIVVNDVVNVMAEYQPVCKRAVHYRVTQACTQAGMPVLILLMYGANMNMVVSVCFSIMPVSFC